MYAISQPVKDRLCVAWKQSHRGGFFSSELRFARADNVAHRNRFGFFRARTAIACFVLALSMLSTVCSVGEDLLSFKGAVGDETEFLLYNYRFLRSLIPDKVHEQSTTKDDLAQLRGVVNRYHEYMKDRQLDADTLELYANLLKAIDCFDDYVSELSRIDRGILSRRQIERTESSYQAGFAGGTAVAAAQQNNMSGRDTALAGVAATVVTYYFAELQKHQALDEAKTRAFEAASESFKRKMSINEARERNALGTFAIKYKWRKDESGEWVDRYGQKLKELTAQYAAADTAAKSLEAAKSILARRELDP